MNEFTLTDYLDIIKYRIGDGSDFGWRCYGEDAYHYSYTKYTGTGWDYELSIIFDTETLSPSASNELS